MVGCSFQRWPSTSWSMFSMITVETRAKQLAKSCSIWSTATWCPWISMAGAAGCQLEQFERSRLLSVPRFANLVAMFGQFVETPCFFPTLRAIVTAVLWQHLTTLKGQKCEIDSCKWSDLKKPLARGAATDCPPFIDSPDKMAYLCHPLTSHIVIFSRLRKPPRCAIYAEVHHQQHRHLKSCQESLLCHLVGGNFGGPTPINGTFALQVKRWGSSCF